MVQMTPTAASADSPAPFKPVFRGVVDASSDVAVRGNAVSAFTSSNDEYCGLGSGGGRSPSSTSSDCAGGAFHPFFLPPPRRVSAVETSFSSSPTTTTTASPTTIIFREAAVDWAATTTAEEQVEFGGRLRSPLLLQRANPIREGNVDEDDDVDDDSERSRSGSRSSSRSRRRPRDDMEDEEEMEYSSHDGRSATSRTRRRTRSAAMRRVVGEQGDLEELFHPCQEGPYFQPFVSLENVLSKLPSSTGRSDTFGAAAHVPASSAVVAPTTLLLPRRQPWDDAYDDHHDDDDAPMDAAPDGGSGFRWQPRRHPDDDEGMDENENARGGGGQHPMVDYSRFFDADLYNDRIVLLCDSHAVDDDGDSDGEDDLWRGPSHEIGLVPGGGGGVAALTDVVDIDDKDVDDDFSLSSEEASSILDNPALVVSVGARQADAFWEEDVLGASWRGADPNCARRHAPSSSRT